MLTGCLMSEAQLPDEERHLYVKIHWFPLTDENGEYWEADGGYPDITTSFNRIGADSTDYQPNPLRPKHYHPDETRPFEQKDGSPKHIKIPTHFVVYEPGEVVEMHIIDIDEGAADTMLTKELRIESRKGSLSYGKYGEDDWVFEISWNFP